MRFVYVVGARPNFVKTAPVVAEMRRRFPDARHVLVHTGQHYDEMMSDVFLEELGVGRPDYMLGVGSASHAVQTARIMERIEPVLEEERPDLVVVPGDVNSTLAVALVATKMGTTLAHLESGLRSFDRSMPEEINGSGAGRGLVLVDPLGYLEFLSLEADAAGVLTDSGGIQEETTYLGIPCFTLRGNTERPITIRAGTNTLLGLDPERIDDILPALR